MFATLGLGFLLGMQHALEADHIAAVSSIAARRTDIGDILKHGLTWGLGHTLTLFAFAGAAILLGQAIPEIWSRPLETAGGLAATACTFTATAIVTAPFTSTRTAMPTRLFRTPVRRTSISTVFAGAR